ncbi:beta-ketoacyl reductase, partial [Nocardia sp. NPDC051911]|uniref:beta-ketoacyl reductase n=1 Tax=Nocardia sp. NPDC051911 TaxID=3154648 RepID=UPI0034122C78
TTPNLTTYHPNHHRIPLPTYPFQQHTHWLTKREPAPGTTWRTDIGDWFYAPAWQRSALPAERVPEHAEHWLVFADDLGVGEAVAQRLRDGGAAVTIVRAAEGWSAPARDAYTVHPTRFVDYERLFTALSDRPPTRFVHCWTVTTVESSPPDDHQLGFVSLLRLGQVLTRANGTTPRRLWVFSSGLHDVVGTESLSPAKATLLGPSRVLPRELPGLRCHSVDLDYHAAPGTAQLDRLMAELSAEPGGTDTIAHRGPHRWTQHYVPRPLPIPALRPVIRSGGVYLITGGTGGLGLALAGHLAHAGARLVLTARTALPPVHEWDGWLTEHTTGPVADTVRTLARLRDLGAELLVVRADVGDHAAMRSAIEQAVGCWGAIDGVFHAAGIAGGGLIQLKELSTAEAVLRPKVLGTLVLEEVLAEQDLDFLVLFGSNGANVGSAGQVDYCAANCFLDAFAQDRGRRQRVITIDWGPWKDVGMTRTTSLPPVLEQARRTEVDRRGMSVGEGLRALDAILASAGEAQIIVSPTDPVELIATALTVDHDAEPAATTHIPVPPPEVPVGDAERVIREVWEDLLGLDRVGTQDSFFDLGGNSLIAIQLIRRINTRLSARLTVSDLWECPTVAHLAGRVRPPQLEPAADVAGKRRESLRKRHEHQQRRRAARSK